MQTNTVSAPLPTKTAVDDVEELRVSGVTYIRFLEEDAAGWTETGDRYPFLASDGWK